MHRSNSYDYSYPPSNTTKQQSSNNMHGTSSAFSANANPNEDWTKISDLAERRRIQNRIAQRNYRKKLKRRLEDLERRAASSSASPEQSHAEPEPVKPQTKQAARSTSSSTRSRQSSKSHHWNSSDSGMSLPPASSSVPDDRSMFSQQSTRQLSTSPPSFFYPSYPPYSDPYGHSTYAPPPPLPPPSNHHPYHTISQPQYGDLSSVPPHHLETLPHPLNSGGSAMKRMSGYGDDEVLNPLCINYASMAGIDMQPHPHHHQHHPHHAHLQLTNDRPRHLPIPTLATTPGQRRPPAL